MPINQISADELPRLLKDGCKVIDVRSPAEFRAAHVSGAQLLPLDQLESTSLPAELAPEKPVYILCQSGKRATMAAQKLEAAGHTNAIVVTGGTDAAIKAGIAITRGEGVISIERQVRIAAGALVAVGSLLGLGLHGGFFGVPILVGCGLVFAGITDTCAMGTLLARMPWNH